MWRDRLLSLDWWTTRLGLLAALGIVLIVVGRVIAVRAVVLVGIALGGSAGYQRGSRSGPRGSVHSSRARTGQGRREVTCYKRSSEERVGRDCFLHHAVQAHIERSSRQARELLASPAASTELIPGREPM